MVLEEIPYYILLKVQRKNPVGIPWFVPYPVSNPCFVLFPVRIPLVYYFHALCRSCKFTWFLLSSKKGPLLFLLLRVRRAVFLKVLNH